MSMTLFPAAVPQQERNRCAVATKETFPEAFSDLEAARAFLRQIILPPSMRWAFMSVGKNGSSSVLRLLFRAEFGCDLSVAVRPLHDVNPSAEVHMLADEGVFSRAILRGLTASDLLSEGTVGERICVVRDPYARAVSAFRYLCFSHREQSRWFAKHRFRMNALTRFDWESHSDTREGFIRFLDYVRYQLETDPAHEVDAHWRPQVDFIKPAVFQPTLTGRMEAFDTFLRGLQERFDIPTAVAPPAENVQKRGGKDGWEDRETRALCEALYAADYESFGY